MEFSYQRGKIVITPRLVMGRSRLSNTADEYTPSQRSAIDARLSEGLADIKAGRTHGPFQTHEEMMAFLNKKPQERKSKRTKK